MDFFAHQNRVQRSRQWLVVFFGLAVLACVVVADILVAIVFGLYETVSYPHDKPAILQWVVISIVSLLVLASIAVASLYRLTQLQRGSDVAISMGATRVPEDTNNAYRGTLRRIIEEVAIASSIPVPDVFIMEREQGINAFAAGYTPSDAAICLTQGCLDHLTHDELQGVVAHVFAYVLNGNMRVNTHLVGLLFGISGLGVAGHSLLHAETVGDGRHNRQASWVMGSGRVLTVIGYIGFFMGRFIQAMASRSGELVADTLAVQVTNKRSGLAGALKKMAALERGSQLVSHNGQEISHMLFAQGQSFSGLLATHSPLRRRLKALGVSWDKDEMDTLARNLQRPSSMELPEVSTGLVAGFTTTDAGDDIQSGLRRVKPSLDITWGIPPHPVSECIGRPDEHDLAFAALLRDNLSSLLRALAADSKWAERLFLALVLNKDGAIRSVQLEVIGRIAGRSIEDGADKVWHLLGKLNSMQRLSLANLMLSSLRRKGRQSLQLLHAATVQVITADNRIDLHEYCLLYLFQLQLQDLISPVAFRQKLSGRLDDCIVPFARLCALMAHYGNEDNPQAAENAFTRAVAHIDTDIELRYALPQKWQRAVNTSLHLLGQLEPTDKRYVINTLGQVISTEGATTMAEAEMLRIICGILRCPLPLLYTASLA